MALNFLIFGLFLTLFSVVSASDSSPLQDLCVADFNSSVVVNGFVCKDPSQVQADDFFAAGLPATVQTIPGLNTLGLAMVEINMVPSDIIDPHHHPRATEIHVLLEGQVEVGFIAGNRLVKKVLNKGDVFVFPQGLIHFQRNIGSTNSTGISFFNSQAPGFIFPVFALFGSDPSISTDLLAKAFLTDKKTIKHIAKNFNFN